MGTCHGGMDVCVCLCVCVGGGRGGGGKGRQISIEFSSKIAGMVKEIG